MKVEVIQQLLIPGVQHGDKAKLPVEPPLRIAGKSLQRLFGRCKQYGQHHSHVDQDERVKLMGQRKHIMEV